VVRSEWRGGRESAAPLSVVGRAHASDGSCVTYSQAVACSCATVPLPPPLRLHLCWPTRGALA
jgi:hypothetical protein